MIKENASTYAHYRFSLLTECNSAPLVTGRSRLNITRLKMALQRNPTEREEGLNVTASLIVHSVSDVDSIHSEFSIDCTLYLYWSIRNTHGRLLNEAKIANESFLSSDRQYTTPSDKVSRQRITKYPDKTSLCGNQVTSTRRSCHSLVLP